MKRIICGPCADELCSSIGCSMPDVCACDCEEEQDE